MKKRSTFRRLRKAQNANLKWMLEAASKKFAASTQQLRAKIESKDSWTGRRTGFNCEWRYQLG